MGLLVVGAGGHGSVVADAAVASGWEVVGFVDGREALRGTERHGVTVVAIGEQEGIQLALSGGHAVIIAIGDPAVRGTIAEAYVAAGVNLATIVHPTAWLSPSVSVGEGSVIFAGVVVQAGSTVKRNCILNTGCTVDHDSVLGDLVHLSPGVHMGGNACIGQGTHIGVGASVRNGVAIGSWSVIGVGSAVVGDIPRDTVAYGVPARPMGPSKAR